LDAKKVDACYNSSVMPRIIRVAIETIGCKLIQAESESFARHLALAGFTVVNADEKPMSISEHLHVTQLPIENAARRCVPRAAATPIFDRCGGMLHKQSADEIEALKCVDMLLATKTRIV
jgi:tRNA A37 methylthiotransferase MiaB